MAFQGKRSKKVNGLATAAVQHEPRHITDEAGNKHYEPTTVKPTAEQVDIGEAAGAKQKASVLAKYLQGGKSKLLRAWWIAHIAWPFTRRLGVAKCALNHHDWEDAPPLNDEGLPVTTKPGIYQRCKRPNCRVFRGLPKLVQAGKWLQTDDFMVLASMQCRYCAGRGYPGKMIINESTRAKRPCTCLRIQPNFVERIPESELRRKKKAVTQ